MGAQLNIKSDEAYALASRLAERDGISITQAVIEALRAREKERSVAEKVERAMEICRDMRARMSPETLAFDINTELYDEDGLPK